MRLAIIASHPIQYQVPLFRQLANTPGLDVKVYFCSNWGLDAYYDQDFGETFAWNIPLLGGYDHHMLRSFGKTSSSFWGLFNPEIVSILRAEHFDAVLIHGWAYASNLLTLISMAMAGVPVLMRAESSLRLEPSGAKLLLKRAILKPYFKGVSGFLAIGSENAAFYRSYGVPDDKIFNSPYSVDNQRFFEEAAVCSRQRDQIRQDFGISDNAPVVLFSGKLIDRKRPLDLIEAYRQASKNSRAWLLFVGSGQLRQELEAFVAANDLTRVRFLGFQNQAEICRAYAAADVMVLPSSYETWGLVVNEAMCFGLPVITSDRVGSCTDLIRDGKNGYVCPVGDVSCLADRLRLLVDNTQHREQLGQAARTRISSWGIEETVAGLVRAVHAVSARQPAVAT